MALPKLNDSPSYSAKVPSTGKKVTFRPYLVKEEKVLMIAFETGQQNEILKAVVDTIHACVTQDISKIQLTTFDIEYLFTQIRSKSVGEKSTVVVGCKECNHKNEVELNINEIEISVPDAKSRILPVTDSISIEMDYPSFDMLLNMDQDIGELDLGFKLVGACMTRIHTEEETIEVSDSSETEIMEFLESMTAEQFKVLSTFISNMPTMKKELQFLCESCGTANETVLQGIGDFLS